MVKSVGFVPENVSLPRAMEVERLFVRVMDFWPPAFPKFTMLQLRDPGDTVAVPADGTTPVPDKLPGRGDALWLLKILQVVEAGPTAAG